jgi:8-oxo-dGTP pyrophosphatase MutT (NUDIX family)
VKALFARFYRAFPAPLVKFALRRAHTKFNVTAVGIFFDEKGKVSVLRHVYRHHHSWGLPAGFLGAGETPEAGMLRELKEETALSAHVTDNSCRSLSPAAGTWKSRLWVRSTARRFHPLIMRFLRPFLPTHRTSHQACPQAKKSLWSVPQLCPVPHNSSFRRKNLPMRGALR